MKQRPAGLTRELVSMDGYGKATVLAVPPPRGDAPTKPGSLRLPGKLSKLVPAVYLACLGAVSLFLCAPCGYAQSDPYQRTIERTFLQSKTAVERALKGMQSAMAGRLPVLEGFAIAGNHPLDHYQRAYYQSAVEVSSTANGGSRVRVSSKVTAWYADPSPSRSGYQLLTSNGRLETDLLDQLEDQLAQSSHGGQSNSTVSSASQPADPSTDTESPIPSAPMPRTSDAGNALSSSLGRNLPAPQPAGSGADQAGLRDPSPSNLKAEEEGLEEILKNQSHPNNLVAVKESGTPVVATASLTAKTLFLASEHDEFEMLDFNADWVHVRISGLSRGWIWRTSLEMPGDIPDVDPRTAPLPAASDLFRVTREETAPFPGDWQPLAGKTVKIISVQPTSESAKEGGPQVKLAFAKSLLDKSYGQVPQNSPDIAGIVLIFDSSDGGMIAATLSALRQWKAGALSDSALWHRCYFDPPETFGSSGPSASQ